MTRRIVLVLVALVALVVATDLIGQPQVARATPTASGAEPPYPLNHTLDSHSRPVGTPPANLEFEEGGYVTGTPPTNYDFETTAVDGGTPSNYDYASGDFTDWTYTGSPVIDSDAEHGYFAKITGSQTIRSGAFTVTSTAQLFTFDVGYLNTNGYSWVKVYAFSGAGYATETYLSQFSCYKCGTWERAHINVGTLADSSVKLEFRIYASSGPAGIDNVRAEESFPNYDVVGDVAIASASGNEFARLYANGGSLTTEAFTIDAGAQRASVSIKGLTTGSDQYSVKILSGVGYTTSTNALVGTASDDWVTHSFDLSPWYGESVKLQLSRISGRVGYDDIGLMRVEVPDWDITETTILQSGGPEGNYVSTTGSLTSQAFTLPTDVQQISLRAADGSGGSAIYYVELLRGGSFETTTAITGPVYPDDSGAWEVLPISVADFAGETVKLRLRQYWGTVFFDTAGVMEETLPGWTPDTNYAIVVGEDEQGTYVTPHDNTIYLESSFIHTGILDTPSQQYLRYYSLSYDITSGAIVRAWWHNDQSQSWQVYTGISETGYQTGHFYLADWMGERGYFRVQIAGDGGRIYSIADNIARQQMREPFTHRAGIDTSTGAFGYETTDITLEGRVPVPFGRYYYGHDASRGVLGYRWTHTFETRLEFLPYGDIAVVFGTKGEEEFEHQGGTTYTPADVRVQAEFQSNGNGTYTLTATDNWSYHFDSSGVLTSLEDLNGNEVTFTYTSGLLSTITDPDGRTLDLAYDANGRLETVEDPEGGTVTYAYDASGDLVSVTDPDGGDEKYTYSRHRLLTITDANDDLVVANLLDDYNRVIEQTDDLGKTIDFAYDSPAKGATQVTDQLGKTATYYFDEFQRTTDKVDPLGHIITYIYDDDGFLTTIIDPLNNEWEFEYDSEGNLTTLTDPLLRPIGVAYNPLRLPTSVTDGRGNTTTYIYDGDGNLLTVTDPLSRVTTYTYDSDGNVLTVTNPENETTTYTYDGSGNRTSMTDPLNNTWEWTYDGVGRVLTEEDPLGNVTEYVYRLGGQIATVVDPLDNETIYGFAANGALVLIENALQHQVIWTYDERGLAVKKADEAGKEWLYRYDDTRRLVEEEDPLGNITTYAYDDSGRVTAVEDAENGITSYTYDDAGRITGVEDPIGRVTEYTYDDAGNVLTMSLPNGGVWEYTYDGNNNLLTEEDPLDNVTTYVYDDANQLVSVIDPLTNVTEYTYDDAGRLVELEDALDQVTAYAYDAAGRLTSVTDPLSNVVTYGYDIAGRRTSVTDAENRTTTFAFDANGRLVMKTDALSNATTFAYDALGRQTSVTRPSSNVTVYAYDPRGLLLTITDALSNVTTYSYDDAGRQVEMEDPRGYSTTYAYDGVGRMLSMTDAQSGVVSFAYDAAGQMTSLTNARGKTTTFTYDALGNVLTETDPEDREPEWAYNLVGQNTGYTDGRSVTQTYSYDDLGRRTGVTYPGGSVSYTYDALSRMTAMTDATGTTAWTYDGASRVTEVDAPNGVIGYSYNDAGQRTGMELPGSRLVSYDYDTAGRLDELTDWNSDVTTFGYNADGQRTTITRPNGVTSTYTYDAAGRLVDVNHADGGGTLLDFAYTLDANGNRTSVTTAAGTESYTLDSLNRLTSVTYANNDVVDYTYDATGNRLTETLNGGTPVSYTYDDADKLISVGGVAYTYDDNGNLTGRGSEAYTWDYASRLASATVNSTTTTYEYDAEGMRVSKDVGGNSVDYLWDLVPMQTAEYACDRGACCGGANSAATWVPLVVDDGSTAYLHADDLIAEIDGSTDRTDVLLDGLNSVRGLADDTSSLVGTVDHEVFGSIAASSGTSSVFGFTGEQHDAETGFTYLRARYLDPTIGQFISTDTVRPNAPGTQGYNLYAYVANNPTTLVDPTGHAAAAVPVAPIPSARPFAGSGYVAALAVSAAAAPGLYELGQKLVGVFELLAVIFDESLRSIWNLLQANSQHAACVNAYIGHTTQCDTAGYSPAKWACCRSLARQRLLNCEQGNSFPKLPWEAGYLGECEVYE